MASRPLVFAPIAGFSDYIIDDATGRIVRYRATSGAAKALPRTVKVRDGRAKLVDDGGTARTVYAARLNLLTHRGPGEGIAEHLDRDRSNLAISNLRWSSFSAVLTGRARKARTVLGDADRWRIAASSRPARALAREFDVSTATVIAIRKR